MINFLKDLSKEVNILGEYPSIVNHNNTAVRKEFAHWFNERENEYIRNMNSPTGYAKAHWGEFVNLKCKSLSIIDTSITFSADYFNELFSELSSHNTLGNRFYYQLKNTLDTTGFPRMTDFYVHDDMLIMSNAPQEWKESHASQFNTTNQMVGGYSLRTELNSIEADVSLLMANLTVKDVSGNNAGDKKGDGDSSLYGASSRNGLFGSFSDLMNRSIGETTDTGTDEDFVNVLSDSTTSYTEYPDNLYTAPARTIKSALNAKSDYSDIRSGMTGVRYVDVTDDTAWVKLQSGAVYRLRANVSSGRIIGIIPCKGDGDLRVILNPQETMYIPNSNLRTSRVRLVCTKPADDKQGGEWDIYSFSGYVDIQNSK